MQKKKLFLILLMGIFSFNVKVNAGEIFYQNENGVILTENEYNFFSEMYWKGYQEFLTQEDFIELKKLNIFEQQIEKKEWLDAPISRNNTVTSNLRQLTISKACSQECVLTLVTSWIGSPFIKSYDVVGARIANSSLTSVRSALVSGTNYGKSYSNSQTFNNGFGYSILLPNVSNLKITLTFTTTKGGTAYGSYQHANTNTSELISKQYTIGAGEYGNVFHFNGNARTVYDNAPGVDISLN